MTTDTVPKILVVDDDPEIRHLVHRFLNQKYQVDSATDGETALALFEKIKPLLVVLDGNLPILQAITSARKCSAVLMFLRSCTATAPTKLINLKSFPQVLMTKYANHLVWSSWQFV
jgi:CheY-like chemotaxis protein